MTEDLAFYFHENVLVPYEHYRQIATTPTAGRRSDTRAALVVGTALYHLREHIPSQRRRTRAGIAKLCPDYDLLGDIVNLSKHKTLTKGPPSKILSLEDMQEQVLFTEYRDAAGAYTHAAKRIVLKLADGSTRS